MEARISISATLLVMVLVGCTSIHSDFKRAQSLNTISAYQSFLDAHPDSQYTNQARIRITELSRQQEEAERLRSAAKEQAAYAEAIRSDSLNNLQKWVFSFPSG
jgi:outer membrane protein assembly factor BamD (BamD/ComL family)